MMDQPFGPRSLSQVGTTLDNLVALNNKALKLAVTLEVVPAVTTDTGLALSQSLWEIQRDREELEQRLIEKGKIPAEDVEVSLKARAACRLRDCINHKLRQARTTKFALFSAENITTEELEADLWSIIKLKAARHLAPIGDSQRWMLVSIYTKGLVNGVGKGEKLLFFSCGMDKADMLHGVNSEKGIFPDLPFKEEDRVSLFKQKVRQAIEASNYFFKHQKEDMTTCERMTEGGILVDCVQDHMRVTLSDVLYLRVRMVDDKVAKSLLGTIWPAITVVGGHNDRDLMGNYPYNEINLGEAMLNAHEAEGTFTRTGGNWPFFDQTKGADGADIHPFCLVDLMAKAKRSELMAGSVVMAINDSTPAIATLIKLYPASQQVLRATIYRVAGQLIIAAGEGGPDNRWSEENCQNYATKQVWRSTEHVFVYRFLKLSGTDKTLSPFLNPNILASLMDAAQNEPLADVQSMMLLTTTEHEEETKWEESLSHQTIKDLGSIWIQKHPNRSKLINAIVAETTSLLEELDEEEDSPFAAKINLNTAKFIWLAITRQQKVLKVDRQLISERHKGVTPVVGVSIMRDVTWQIVADTGERRQIITQPSLASVYYQEEAVVQEYDKLAKLFRLVQTTMAKKKPGAPYDPEPFRRLIDGRDFNIAKVINQVHSVIRTFRFNEHENWARLVPTLKFIAVKQGWLSFTKVLNFDLENELGVTPFRSYDTDRYCNGEEVRRGGLPALNINPEAAPTGTFPYANDPEYKNGAWQDGVVNVIGSPTPTMEIVENTRVSRYAEARPSKGASPKNAYMFLAIERDMRANGKGNYHHNNVNSRMRQADSQNHGKDGFIVGLLAAGKGTSMADCHSVEIGDLGLVNDDGSNMTMTDVAADITQIMRWGSRFSDIKKKARRYQEAKSKMEVGKAERDDAEETYLQALLPLREMNLFQFIHKMKKRGCEVILMCTSTRAAGAWLRAIRLGHLEFGAFLQEPRIQAMAERKLGFKPELSLDKYLPEEDLILITPIIESDYPRLSQ